jgi:hypothetical protein
MAYTTIKKPSDYFNTKLWTGNGGTQSITGVGFQPDWSVIKRRNAASGSQCIDAVRGVIKKIAWNESGQENDVTNGITSFDSDGYTLGDSAAFNGSGDSHVGWSWKANGTGSANTDGSISSTVSASATSGFSIVKYTAGSSGANTDTIGHGLGVIPQMIILKTTTATDSWVVYHHSNGAGKSMVLNSTTAVATNSNIFPTTPTSSVFYPGNTATTNSSSRSYIAYCFADVKGFSKFSSYIGNGSTDGTFCYTGMKPAFVMIKATGSADWYLIDNKRATYNVMEASLKANTSDAESTTIQDMDFLSNGFKPRSTSGSTNGSGTTYIYMAFAEQPLVGDNPATAR